MEKHYVREFKSKHSTKCLFGTCPDCSHIKDGQGIHDIEVYEVFECTEEEDCSDCDGQGTVEKTCPHCDGSGTVYETCEGCKGKGKNPDEYGEKVYVKDEMVLKKNENRG